LKKVFYIFILISFSRQVLGQTNLVPNWSFETYTACPNSSGQLPYATFWNCAPSCGEYWNVCGTPPYNVPSSLAFYYQLPKDGNAFITLQTWSGNYREYAQIKLLDTLKNGFCYYGEFYVNVANGCAKAINNLSANLSQIPYSSSTALNIPQHIIRYGNPVIKDTMNWVKVSGLYQAIGGEIYLTIGNMLNDAGTTTVTIQPSGSSGVVHLFDAVSVFSINPTGPLPWTYNDTIINYGDSVYIGNYLGGGFSSNWYLQGGGFIKNGSGLYVKPTVTSNYIIQFTVCGVPRADTLKVVVNGGVGITDLVIKNSELIISPNPNNGFINIEIQSKDIILSNSEIKIYDIFNREIKTFKLTSKKQTLELQDIDNGVYYIQLLQDDKLSLTKKIIKQ
jgi:hypothetical protein